MEELEGRNAMIQFTRPNVLYFQQGNSTVVHATIQYVPRSTGEHWIFRDGDFIFTLNPMCHDFVGLVFETEGR